MKKLAMLLSFALILGVVTANAQAPKKEVKKKAPAKTEAAAPKKEVKPAAKPAAPKKDAKPAAAPVKK
ncbi:MAG: hypothetical protein WCI31_01855 [Prolixibacteraceae bacterium]